ncbi:hypothetical protein HK102_002737 [Quaeritorhiza haematococci]|nr:hypothetical protein HK102_002737 [Quaeritorhiza haematococci]
MAGMSPGSTSRPRTISNVRRRRGLLSKQGTVDSEEGSSDAIKGGLDVVDGEEDLFTNLEARARSRRRRPSTASSTTTLNLEAVQKLNESRLRRLAELEAKAHSALAAAAAADGGIARASETKAFESRLITEFLEKVGNDPSEPQTPVINNQKGNGTCNRIGIQGYVDWTSRAGDVSNSMSMNQEDEGAAKI